MTTPRLQLHHGEAQPPIYSADDLEVELHATPAQVVALARADVASDLELLGAAEDDLPAQLVRRMIATRSLWRAYLRDGSASAIVVGSDYNRLLDEADLIVERSRPRAPKARAGKGH